MWHTIRSLWLLFFLTTMLSSASAQLSFHDWTLAQARQAANAEDKLFFLYFTADWCAPCQWMEAHTLNDAELTDYVTAHYLAVEIDIDQGTAALLRKQFSVEDIPSILVFSAAGQLIDRHKGTIGAQELEKWLRALDQPAHHLDAVQTATAPVAGLSSPQAHLGFSRPALGRSESIEHLSAHETPGAPQLILAGEPIAAANQSERFIPRDGRRYVVMLTDTNYTYQEAIDAVARLEQKYQQRTELEPQPDGTHRIVLGEFTRRQAAQEFLIYLRRNNRSGEILTLSR